MSEHIAFEDPVGRYLAYLNRAVRTSNIGLWQAHQQAICRIVAAEYGVTQEQILWLDSNL